MNKQIDNTVIELQAQMQLLERRLDFLTEYADELLMADYRAFVAAEEVAVTPVEVEVYLEDLVIY